MNGALKRGGESRIVGLDGLRALSILLVVLGHGWSTIPIARNFPGLGAYLGNSSLGVTTFFVISGYLITFLLCNERRLSGTISLPAFYMRRVLRIFPALYLYLLILVLVRSLGLIHTTNGDLGIAATYLANYNHLLPIATNADYWFVGHFWSLSLEEQFYLLWPVTLLVAGLARSRGVALLIVVVSPVMRVITYAVWPEARGQIGMMLQTAVDSIMVGCYLALVEGRPGVTAFWNRVSSWVWPLATGVFLVLVSPWMKFRFEGAYTITIGMTLNSLAIALLIGWVVRSPESGFSRALSTPVLRYIGTRSYGLYLWQQLFLAPTVAIWVFPFPLNMVASLMAAECSYRCVERPFLRMRDRFRGATREPARSESPLVSTHLRATQPAIDQ